MPRVQSLCLILISSFALAFAGCATDSSPGEETGSLSLNLQLADGITINEVAWTISGGEMEPMTGTIDTSAPGATASVEVFGLPPGDGYLVELEATDETGEITCRGDAPFEVEVGVATDVMVFLNCKRPTTLGGVRVNGELNICAELAKVIVSPLQTSVGYDIDLSAIGQDEEGDPITYVWTATGGSIADANAPETTYTCEEAGQQSITILVTDNDVHCTMATWTVPVTCIGGDDLCEEVTCDDTGNECTVAECNPANGECETSNVDDGAPCDGGAGACMSGECAPNDLCEDVTCDDTGNECTVAECNPTNGECETSNVDDGTSCNGGAGMCVNGTCMDVDLCEGVTCDDTGNECSTALCNPSNGLCEISNLPDGTECAGGEAELAVNGGFETGNLDGWTQFCDGPNNGTCAATMAEAASGSWSGNLVASVPEGGGAASFPLIKNANIGIGVVEPESEVQISFVLKGSLAGAGGVVFAEFFSELEAGGTSKSEILGGGPIFPTGEWVEYSYTTTTGPDVGGGVTLQLKVDCGATPGCTVDAYFDEVSVTTQSAGGVCMDGACGALDLCEGVTCDDTGNECTSAACNPSNGMCEISDAPDGTECDSGNGTCNAGVCEEAGSGEVYTQDFESLSPDDGAALENDGWLYFGNVFTGAGVFKFGFGAFAAPTTTGQISAIATGEGGPDQGAQQLVVFSNYDCCQPDEGHFNGTDLVETIVFQEINAIPGDFIGQLFEFTFDAKRGNIGGSTTAQAFIRTLDPGAGFSTTNNVVLDTTDLPTDWATYGISLNLGDPLLEGQILQFGFSTVAKDFESAGNFYDNNLATVSPTP